MPQLLAHAFQWLMVLHDKFETIAFKPRRHIVETEVPHAQRVPVTLRERHAVIFSRAQQVAASTSASRRALSAQDNSSDEGRLYVCVMH